MGVSVFRGTQTRLNGEKASEPREATTAVETTVPESVDEQIESLLLSLDDPVGAGRPEELPVGGGERVGSPRRATRRRDPLDGGINQFDLVFVATAVVLGIAVGLLTVVLVNG